MLFHDCPDCVPAGSSRRQFLAGLGAADQQELADGGLLRRRVHRSGHGPQLRRYGPVLRRPLSDGHLPMSDRAQRMQA